MMIKQQSRRRFYRTLINSLVFSLMVCSIGVQAAVNEGAYGYLRGSAAEVSCSPYPGLDISSTGTSLVFPDFDADDSEVNQQLPFDFDFFGNRSNQLRIANNGGIFFGTSDNSLDLLPGNSALPSVNLPAAAILPFWDDLDANSGGVYVQTFGTAPFREFHIQWTRAHYIGASDETPSTVRFKTILFEASGTVFFVYSDLDFGDVTFDSGVSATVGIQNNISTASMTSHNSDLTSILGNASPQIECFEPRRVELQLLVEKANQIPDCMSSDPNAEFFPDGSTIPLDAGEALRLCININNSLDQPVNRHRLRITSNDHNIDQTINQSIAANSSGLIISQPITFDRSATMTVQISSFDPIPENDFEATANFMIDVGSILDFIPGIISGAVKP